MTSAIRLVWDLAGRPDPAKIAELTAGPGICAMCGQTADITGEVARIVKRKVIGENLFQDPSAWERLDRGLICRGCVWATTGRGRLSLRSWSIIAAPGQVLPRSSEKAADLAGGPGLCYTAQGSRPIPQILATPPASEWAIGVTRDGQKHLLPYMRINHGSGQWTIRYDTTDVTSTPGMWTEIRTHALALRRLQFSDYAIKAGDYGAGRGREVMDAAKPHVSALRPHLTDPVLDLALKTITKTVIDDKDNPHA